MSAIDQILERLPYSDGAWRRRFISGVIFFSIVFLHGVIAYPQAQLGLEIKNLLQSTQLLLVAALLVFAIGSIIDAIVEGFIVRGVSLSRKVIGIIIDWVPGRRAWRRRLWFAFTALSTCLLWPVAILLGAIASSVGYNKLYRIGLIQNDGGFLTTEAKQFFESLPTSVREGLDEPFGDKFDVAWRSLTDMVPLSQKHWVNRLGSRNSELISFISSVLVSMIVSASIYFPGWQWTISIVLWYAAICFLSYLLFGCISIVGRSICSVLELLAVSASR